MICEHILYVFGVILFLSKMSYGFSLLLLRIGAFLAVFGVTVTPFDVTFQMFFSTKFLKVKHLLNKWYKIFESGTKEIKDTIGTNSVYSYIKKCMQLLLKVTTITLFNSTFEVMCYDGL